MPTSTVENTNVQTQAGLNQFVQQIRPRFEAALKEMVEIPTVSAEPERRADMHRGAEAAARLIREYGGQAEIVQTKGNPIIFGKFRRNDSFPTLTIYNHMDVQPADGPDWTRTPFKMAIEGDRYYGRGTTDDKGPGLSALMAAHYAWKNNFPINIHFLWELEEEIGSPSFEDAVKANREKFKTNSVLVSDTIWIARGKPAIPYGLRGLQGVTMKLQTGKKDVHSGVTGGLARNPIGELADVIAKCYDAKTGKVKIPGFYKDVAKPTKAELDNFTRSGFTIKEFQRANELHSVRKLKPREAVAAIWGMPTFEVHGIAGGYQGPGVKTIVPGWAEAKVSMRLVPKMRPEKMFKVLANFVKKLNKDVVVHAEHGLEPYVGDFSGPYADAAVQALQFGFGQKPAFTREGGSIGAVLTMRKELNCPVNFIGLSLPEHGYHAPNENFDWEQASGGIRSFVKYFELIGRMKS